MTPVRVRARGDYLDIHDPLAKTIAGVAVEPGARIRSLTTNLQFELEAVCDSAEPEQWHGEARLLGVTLLRTPPVHDYFRAARAAEAALKERLVRIFSG